MTKTYLVNYNSIVNHMMKLPPCFLHKADMRSM